MLCTGVVYSVYCVINSSNERCVLHLQSTQCCVELDCKYSVQNVNLLLGFGVLHDPL